MVHYCQRTTASWNCHSTSSGREQSRFGNAVRESTARNALGTITAVIPNETGVDDFTLYEIKFDFGVFTLYGAQIEQEL